MAPVKMPKEQWAKLINPQNIVDGEEEEEAIASVLDRLGELAAILIFRMSDTHSESVGITRNYRHELVKNLDKLWDQYGIQKYEEDD